MSPAHLTTIHRILELVCASRHVTLADIEGPSHASQIVLARYLALELASRFTPLSYYELGLVFNRKTTSISAALKTFRTWCQLYNDRERELEELDGAFRSQWLYPLGSKDPGQERRKNL